MNLPFQDIRYGARLLWKNKGYAATAIITLATCIGVNTAIFSVVHSVILRPLPLPEPEKILLIYNSYPGAGVERKGIQRRSGLLRSAGEHICF